VTFSVDPSVASRPTAAPSGHHAWVLVKTESVDKVDQPGRVKSHQFSEGSFQAEVIPRGSSTPVPMEGTWVIPPPVLRPGTHLTLACTGAIQIALQSGPTRFAFSLPPSLGVWDVLEGFPGARYTYEVSVASSWFNCGWTYTYEWRE
jgi:hypothetical protein